MSQPIFIRIPASTACGIGSKYFPPPSSSASRNTARINAGNRRASSRPDIGDGPDRGAGARHAAEQPGRDVADTLTDQFLVRFVTRTGHGVRDQ